MLQPFNVLRYQPTQHYNSHYDVFDPESYGPQPSQRVDSTAALLHCKHHCVCVRKPDSCPACSAACTSEAHSVSKPAEFPSVRSLRLAALKSRGMVVRLQVNCGDAAVGCKASIALCLADVNTTWHACFMSMHAAFVGASALCCCADGNSLDIPVSA